jgi:hypothetical protein
VKLLWQTEDVPDTGLLSLLTKQDLGDITIKILFLPACCVNDCSIDHAGISKEDRVKEGLDIRPAAVHTDHCADGGGGQLSRLSNSSSPHPEADWGLKR